MDIVTDRLLRGNLPLFRTLAFLLCVISVAVLLKLGKDVLMPLALAVLLSFALGPIVSFLERIGVSRAASVALTILTTLGFLCAILYLVYAQASDLAERLPAYRATIVDKLRLLTGGVGEAGPFARLSQLTGELLREFGGSKQQANSVIVTTEDSGGMIGMLGPALGNGAQAIAVFGLVLLMAAFVLLQREELRNRIIRLAGADDIHRTTIALDDAATRLGRLLLAQLAINFCFGVTVGVAIWLLGLPSAFLWGVLAGLLRYIPYIGTIAGMAPPLLLAFVIDPGWTTFIYTLIFFLVVDFVVAHVLEPLLFGRSTGLSPFAVILSVAVWSFLWGGMGLIIAVPMALCLVVLGRHVNGLAFLETVLGDRPALPARDILYQRLLAGDPREAGRLARAVLVELTAASYFDEVVLPSLRRAHLDVVRGQVAGGRLEILTSSAQTFVADLSNKKAPVSTNLLRAETKDIAEKARESGFRFRKETRFAKGRSGRAVVVHLDNVFDATIARMLAFVIEEHGMEVVIRPMFDANCEDDDAYDVVFISAMEPVSIVHMRAALMRVRRRAGREKVHLCIWQELGGDAAETLRRRLKVRRLLVTMQNVEQEIEALQGASR